MSDINTMLEEVEPLVIHITRKRLKGWPAGWIDDLRQNIRLAMWQTVLPKYQPDRCKLTTFAWRAIQNLVTEELRKLHRRGLQFTDTELNSLDVPAEMVEQHPIDAGLKRITDAIPLLPQADRKLITSILNRDEPDKSVKAGTMNNRRHQAYKRLREIIFKSESHPTA